MPQPRVIFISSANRTNPDETDSDFSVTLAANIHDVSRIGILEAIIPNSAYPFNPECCTIWFREDSHESDLMVATLRTDRNFIDLPTLAAEFERALGLAVCATDPSIHASNDYHVTFLAAQNKLKVYTSNAGLHGFVIYTAEEVVAFNPALPKTTANRKLGFLQPFPGWVNECMSDASPFLADSAYYISTNLTNTSITTDGSASVLACVFTDYNFYGYSHYLPQVPIMLDCSQESISKIEIRVIDELGHTVDFNGIPIKVTLTVDYALGDQ
jgi:hypothetical protein